MHVRLSLLTVTFFAVPTNLRAKDVIATSFKEKPN